MRFLRVPRSYELNFKQTRSATLSRILVIALASVLLIALLSGCQRYRDTDSEYELAAAQIEAIQSMLDERELYELSAEDMEWLEREFRVLEERIDNIDELSSLPLGLDGVAERGSARYRAAMETLDVARLLAEAGIVVANIGNEVLTALDETGIRAEPGVTGETWLDVLERRESELSEALDTVDRALAMRQQINDSEAPNRVQTQLAHIDSMSERFNRQRELVDDLPLAFIALGAEEPVRYLVLFQNPAEMRPTGGFIGTIAFVEVERGQIINQQFHDVYEISQDYQARAEDPIDPPWAISEYIRPDFLQYHDANWWPDFATTGPIFVDMTRSAGWPEVHAVAAVQPTMISDLISITGPITVEVDGEERVITSDNVHDEAERQRRISREGETPETGHKEVVGLIGEVLLEELSDSDREQMIDAAFLVFDALDRRDVQAFHEDELVQAFLEERNWAGLVEPEPGSPTIAPIFANVTGLKTSLAMQPSMRLEISETESGESAEIEMTIALEHLGAAEGDPFYEGFQRWWLGTVVPESADVVETSPETADDPDAGNGGSWIVNLDVGERQEIVTRFTIPEAERVLIRRQPGLVPMATTVVMSGCENQLEFDLERDTVLLLDGPCPAIEVEEEDAYSARD